MVRTFFQRFGTHGICVLPSDVLSNDLLHIDPEAHTVPPTLRKEASVLGLCYARVLRCFADGLYWAEVASTPDLVDAQRVLLTEEQLYHALPWDVCPCASSAASPATGNIRTRRHRLSRHCRAYACASPTT